MSTLGDALDGLGDLAVGAVEGLLLLNVQVLGVLADDDQVDGVAFAAADGGLDGAHVGVQVELLAESDDGGRVAGDLGARGAVDGVSRFVFCKGIVAYLTAPKRAPSHSFFRVSTVLSGRAVPVFWKVPKPASRSTKLNLRFRDEGRDSRTLRPAYIIPTHPSQPIGLSLARRLPTGMTSRPIPSPGMRPI